MLTGILFDRSGRRIRSGCCTAEGVVILLLLVRVGFGRPFSESEKSHLDSAAVNETITDQEAIGSITPDQQPTDVNLSSTTTTTSSSSAGESVYSTPIANSDFTDTSDTMMMADIFGSPFPNSGPPLSRFPEQATHPVAPTAIDTPDRSRPIPTNKFYSNLYLGSGSCGVWTLPYSVSVNRDAGAGGFAISHIEAHMLALGPDPNQDPVQYYINPVGIRHMQLGAQELGGAGMKVTLNKPGNHHVNVVMQQSGGGGGGRVTFPLSQGMGFVTGVYSGLTPVVSSAVMFRQISAATQIRAGLQKWRVTLEDGTVWVVYAAGDRPLNLVQKSNKIFQANTGPFTGLVQIAKLGSGTQAESALDESAGAYVADFTISGSVNGDRGSLRFNFTKAGRTDVAPLLNYCLPHQQASFTTQTLMARRDSQLRSTVKGMMIAVQSDFWEMTVDVPTGMEFLPPLARALDPRTREVIRVAAVKEAREIDVERTSNLDSMYFAGKALAKYAQVVLTLLAVAPDLNEAKLALAKLKKAMARFTENRQNFPLVYDSTWKGISSSASFKTGDPNVDFGNSYYNDHHFHYSYFIYTASIISYTERLLGTTNPPYTSTPTHDWVSYLIRDTSTPCSTDPSFPQLRAMDYFHGHSWAKGLYESADGKDQESSSEDAHFAYALYLYGLETGNAQLRDLGLLQLGILKQSLNTYFYIMPSTNVNASSSVHPPKFTKNLVTGILFENKVDHATYFGMNSEFIHGIHMLPTTPASGFVRWNSQWLGLEWERYFSGGRAESAVGGWKSVLMVARALLAPGEAWRWFRDEGAREGVLDDGLSRTWGLVMAAGNGGGEA
ncbi:endo-1,3-beta-glucanase Engl1 [Peziza echinospora]|nr:endo-1,3-beta-glucanase Engl1 [Peziza echinospora]